MKKPPLGLFLLLSGLSAIGPIATDLYLPALPAIADEQHASTSAVQLTLTACLLGLGIGQVLAGPMSDRLGRRGPLLIGMAAFAVSSAACALAPSVELLTLTRGVQGLSGAAGIVISRAIVRDLYEGSAVAMMMSRLMLVMGAAPILAPLLGSALLQVSSWRGLFAIMTGFAVLLLVGAYRAVPSPNRDEHEPTDRMGSKTEDGYPIGATLHALFTDCRFVGAVSSGAFAVGGMFAYISGSSFVFQQVFGLSQSTFAAIFGLNACGLIAFSQVSASLSRRFDPATLLLTATLLSGGGGVALLSAAIAGAGLPFILPSLFLTIASVGLALPNAAAIALSGPRHYAGTASATLGLAQFGVGAALAPLVGAFGVSNAVPMAAVICGCSVLAISSAALTARSLTPVLDIAPAA
jgi:DHA1 family bicyclomycin/chloramphenicol resistance-like MFS transporter